MVILLDVPPSGAVDTADRQINKELETAGEKSRSAAPALRSHDQINTSKMISFVSRTFSDHKYGKFNSMFDCLSDHESLS